LIFNIQYCTRLSDIKWYEFAQNTKTLLVAYKQQKVL